MRWAVAVVGVLFVATTWANHASAWIFSEHTQITESAWRSIEQDPDLSRRLKQVLPALNHGLRLCEKRTRSCPNFAVLPSLAGDHSCTPSELRKIVSGRDRPKNRWVFDVLAIGDKAGGELDQAGTDAALREEIRRQMHVDLQFADDLYVKRALLDYHHFQVPREDNQLGDEGLSAYLRLALSSQREGNAVAAYANYHVAAVRLAAGAAGAGAEREELLVRAFLAEAFALHFLEDAFSTGHFVGHWGDSATRLGTHDFYSRAGFEAVRWSEPNRTYIAHGDAFLSDAEGSIAAQAARRSLAQLLRAATEPAEASRLLNDFAGASGFENYDSCTERTVPPGLGVLAGAAANRDVVQLQPVPSRRDPEVGRVRAEQGFFFGAVAGGGVAYTRNEPSAGGRVVAALRGGYGAADLVNDPINAQAFADVGLVGEYITRRGDNSVVGVTGRLRAPGYFFLVDGGIAILLAQGLKSKCPFCIRWAAAAAAGGAGRFWRANHLFGPVSWQFSLLRDVTLNVFRNQPSGSYRTELLASLFAARSVLPIAGGEAVSQSTDLYLDVGPAFVWTSEHPVVQPGAYAALSVAPRIFP
jgi:hypothetical protein